MEVPKKLRGDVSEKTLDAIANAVDEAESRTSGEIVVRLVHSLLPLESPRARALRDFAELGCQKTRERNGVLLFVVMKKHHFEIVADEGIEAKVRAGTWREIAETLTDGIRRRGFERGICEAVSRIGDVLAEHYPRAAGDEDANELPDRPSVG